jgi:hypothetical protein
MNDEDPRLEDDDEAESEQLEAEILRANRPFASDRWGTTAQEEVAGEGLDRALAEEVPEDTPTDEAVAVVDDAPTDDEKELVGDAVDELDPFAAPEEAAFTVRDDAPGVTEHEEELVDDDVDAVEEYLDEHDGGGGSEGRRSS